jgi:hypothetical protein
MSLRLPAGVARHYVAADAAARRIAAEIAPHDDERTAP